MSIFCFLLTLLHPAKWHMNLLHTYYIFLCSTIVVAVIYHVVCNFRSHETTIYFIVIINNFLFHFFHSKSIEQKLWVNILCIQNVRVTLAWCIQWKIYECGIYFWLCVLYSVIFYHYSFAWFFFLHFDFVSAFILLNFFFFWYFLLLGCCVSIFIHQNIIYCICCVWFSYFPFIHLFWLKCEHVVNMYLFFFLFSLDLVELSVF